MNIGNSLFQARKKCGLSQEEVAEKLGVSRQTISKWETNETVPDIRQSKKMALLYRISLDELIQFDPDVQDIKDRIQQIPEEIQEKINWTTVWQERYPVLGTYQNHVNIVTYADQINTLLDNLKKDYSYDEQDAMLVLKDILYHVFKHRKNKSNRNSK